MTGAVKRRPGLTRPVHQGGPLCSFIAPALCASAPCAPCFSGAFEIMLPISPDFAFVVFVKSHGNDLFCSITDCFDAT